MEDNIPKEEINICINRSHDKSYELSLLKELADKYGYSLIKKSYFFPNKKDI